MCRNRRRTLDVFLAFILRVERYGRRGSTAHIAAQTKDVRRRSARRHDSTSGVLAAYAVPTPILQRRHAARRSSFLGRIDDWLDRHHAGPFGFGVVTVNSNAQMVWRCGSHVYARTGYVMAGVRDAGGQMGRLTRNSPVQLGVRQRASLIKELLL